MEPPGGSESHRSPHWAVELDAAAPIHTSVEAPREHIYELSGDTVAPESTNGGEDERKNRTQGVPIQANPWPFHLEDASPRVYHGPPKTITGSEIPELASQASPWPYHGTKDNIEDVPRSSYAQTPPSNLNTPAENVAGSTSQSALPPLSSTLESSSNRPHSGHTPTADYLPYRPPGSPAQSSIIHSPSSTSNSDINDGTNHSISPQAASDAFVRGSQTNSQSGYHSHEQAQTTQDAPGTYSADIVPDTPPPAYSSISPSQIPASYNVAAAHSPSSESSLRHSSNSPVSEHHAALSPPPLPPRPSFATHTPVPEEFHGASSPSYPPPPKKTNYQAWTGPRPHALSTSPQRPHNNMYQRAGSNKLFGSSSAKKWLDKTNQVLEDTIDAVIQGPAGPPNRPAYAHRPLQPPRPPQGYYHNQQPNPR